MPKKFPTPPDATDTPSTDESAAVNVHPNTGHPLADLLFNGATREQVAEHLRVQRDESRANDLAAWLVLCRDALPVFRRAEVDGCDVLAQLFQHHDYMRLRPLGGDATADAELKRLNELNARHGHAECALLEIKRYAPAMLADPRSHQVGDVADSAAMIELRMRITNYFVEKKLDISPDYDGWPHCESRNNSRTAGAVRLVTVAGQGVRR
jgi:hypothetical protein